MNEPRVWDTKHLRVANDAAGVALWSWNVDTNRITMDERAHALWGVPDTGAVTFEDLSSRIHPEDLDKVRAAFAATRDTQGSYETDFRILHGDRIRWISARGRGDDQGIVGRIMFGVFIDVTVRKLAEEAREMITEEMNHRIKNLFAIASVLTSISARSVSTKEEMVHDLTQRLTALSNAHDLVRTNPNEQSAAGLLENLLATLLKPYADEVSGSNRVHISVSELLVGELSATAIALIIHELATNSIKYGALSSKRGALNITCTAQGNDVVIVWTEKGGPPVSSVRGKSGFGSKLVISSVSQQLDGSIDFAWPPEGVVITLRMSKARLGA
jgi:two-component sensor histidine kinase